VTHRAALPPWRETLAGVYPEGDTAVVRKTRGPASPRLACAARRGPSAPGRKPPSGGELSPNPRMSTSLQSITAHAQPQSTAPVTARAVVIALVLIAPVVHPVTMAEMWYHSAQPSSLSIFANVVMALMVLGLLNLGLRRLLPRWALSRGELLTIFALLSVAQGIAGRDTGQMLIGTHTHAYWFATPENKWLTLFGDYLPKDLMVSDPGALRRFYGGDSSLLRSGDLSLWLRPFGFWLVATMGMMWVSLCLVSLLRRRWIEQERLAFPLAQAPLIMTDEGTKLYVNPAFWWAFGLVSLFNTLRIIHYLYPAFPEVKNAYPIWLFEAGRPWNGVGAVWFQFRPHVISMAFYMPLDLSFSAWFFWAAANGQLLVRSSLGRLRVDRLNQQSVAAWIALIAVALWRARTMLGHYWRVAFPSGATGREASLSFAEAGEAFSARLAYLGLFGGIAFLTWFAVREGMSLPVALFFWVMYFVLILAATRIRAELGAPATELGGTLPAWMLTTVLGVERVGAQNLVTLMQFDWLSGPRPHPQQHAMEAYKLAHESGVKPRGLTWALLAAVAVGFCFVYWSSVTMFYHRGAEHNSFSGYVTYPQLSYHAPNSLGLAHLLQMPTGTNWGDIGQFAAGMAVTIILYALRQRFTSFPLHPIGFALGWSWTLFINWLSIFLGWLLKWGVLHYGGYRTYQKALPVFTGLLVGDFASGWGWNVLCQLLQIPIKGFP